MEQSSTAKLSLSIPVSKEKFVCNFINLDCIASNNKYDPI